MWTTESLIKIALWTILLVLLFLSTVTSFWPGRIFKEGPLNWWRRLVLSVALALVTAAIMEPVKKFGELSFLAAYRPAAGMASLHTVGVNFTVAVLLLLPWFFLPRLRAALDFRVRWSWLALLFLAALAPCLPQFFERISGYNGLDLTVLFSYSMLIGVAEETVFRGYAFQLEPERRPKATILVTSLVFGLLHVNNGLFHFANACFWGMGLGVVRLATRSLGLCIMLHGVWDSVAFTAGVDLRAAHAFWVAITAAWLFHPSCRPIAEPRPQSLCVADRG